MSTLSLLAKLEPVLTANSRTATFRRGSGTNRYHIFGSVVHVKNLMYLFLIIVPIVVGDAACVCNDRWIASSAITWFDLLVLVLY